MTVQDYLEDLYDTLGKDKQLLCYDGSGNFDITVAGSVKMLSWLNRGYRFLLNFKGLDNVNVVFPATRKVLFFQTQILEGTLASATSTTCTFDTTPLASADNYNGWLVSIESGTGSGQVRMIVDYTSARVATVHKAWDTTPDATSTYCLYKRHMAFLASTATAVGEHIAHPADGNILEPLKITYIEDGRDLAYAGRTANFPGNIISYGNPSQWWRYANGIYFNYAVKEEQWYRMEYTGDLADLTASTDEPQIPRQWQEALYMWLVWKGKSWALEPNAAYAAKRDFYDFVRSMRLPEEEMMDREDVGVEVEL